MNHLPRQGVVEVDLPTGGSVRFWSKGDDWITSRVWWLGLKGYELELTAPFLRFAESARVILDVGAYTGYYAILAAATNRSARVFAFEPHPNAAARLGNNLALNEELDVRIIACAVSDSRGPATLHAGSPGLPSSSSLSSEWEGRSKSLAVSTVDIDSFCRDWGLDHIDLVKIDVETQEPAVIKGMRATIEQSRPVIFAEAHPAGEYGAMSQFLSSEGYEFYRLTKDRLTAARELTALSDEPGASNNYLLCPSEKVPDWLGI